LERRTREESKELEGDCEEGPWEIILLPILMPSLVWNFKSPWMLREVKEGRREGPPRFGRGETWWIMEEREVRGGKREDIFTVGPRVEVGRHRSDQWPPLIGPVSP
jgi:hypothetical protein